MAFGPALTALGNIGSIYGYQQQAADAEMKRRQQQLALQQMLQQQAAQAAAGRALYQPMPQGGAQPPMPGAMAGGMPGGPPSPYSVMPSAGGVPQPGGPGGPAPIGAGMSSAPAAAPSQAGGAGPAVPPPNAAPQAQPAPQMPQRDPMAGRYDIETLAKRIKAANPGIDDATLFQAVLAQQHLLLPQEQAELRSELQNMQMMFRQQQLEQNLDFKYQQLDQRERDFTRTAEQRDQAFRERQYNDQRRDDRLQRQFDYKQLVDGKRMDLEKLKAQGVNDRFVQRQNLMLDRDALNEKRRDLIQDPKYKMQAIANDTKDITAKISELLRGRTMDALSAPEKALYQKLSADRDKLSAEADQLVRSAGQRKVALPSLRDLVTGKTKLDLPDPDAMSDDTDAASPGAAPVGMPDASKQPDGAKLKDGQGNIVAIAQGGRWKMVAPGTPAGQ